MWFEHDTGQTYTHNVTVPAMQRLAVSPPAEMPDGGFAIHTGSYNGVPYVVEKSMYLGSGWEVGSALEVELSALKAGAIAFVRELRHMLKPALELCDYVEGRRGGAECVALCDNANL